MTNLARISVFISTAIEVFDLSIFAFLIPVLSSVFFSSHSQTSAINFTILAYVVSYVVKPFSGMVLGICLIVMVESKYCQLLLC